MNASTRPAATGLAGNVSSRSSSPVQAKVPTTVRCKLCGETFEFVSNFRSTQVKCVHCGLSFVFDPQQQPLPVKGVSLRFSEVLNAQRQQRGGRSMSTTMPTPPVMVAKPAERGVGWSLLRAAILLATAAVGLLIGRVVR